MLAGKWQQRVLNLKDDSQISDCRIALIVEEIKPSHIKVNITGAISGT